MPHLNHTGPEGKGPKTGRKLGLCKKKDENTSENQFKLGIGMGKQRKKKDKSYKGKGKRLQSTKFIH